MAHKHQTQRKRATDQVFKRRSDRLAAKESVVYENAVIKASRVKAVKMDLLGVSRTLAVAIEDSGILHRPAPKAIPVSKLCRISASCILRSKLEVLGISVSPPR